jgi:hypothetical protein
MKNRDWLSKALFVLAIAAPALGALGCAPRLDDPDLGPLTSTFAVSDIFSPSGFMGDGENPGYLTVDFEEAHCKQPRPPGAQGRCYSFLYYADPTSNRFWAGAYWVYPTNSWGVRPGYRIDSSKFQQVRFWAAVDMPTPITKNGGGNTFFNGIAGGIDAAMFYGPLEHDDKIKEKDVFQIGTDITSEYKQFHLPLAGQPQADELIGAFAWSLDFPNDSCTCSVPGKPAGDCNDDNGNPGQVNCPSPVRIYIDDIVWDTNPPPATP